MWCLTTIAVLFLADSTAEAAALESLKGLRIRAGDVVTCIIHGSPLLVPMHYMLATGPDTIITAFTEGSFPMSACIKEMETTEASKYIFVEGDSDCQIQGVPYYYTPMSAVTRARQYKDKTYFYDLNRCNSRHWVNKWTNGTGYSSDDDLSVILRECDAY